MYQVSVDGELGAACLAYL
jgi:hypothetical protein